MGERIAAGLAACAPVRRLVLAGRTRAAVEAVAAGIASSADCVVEPVEVDALRPDAVAELLARTRPELVVQCASLRSPWALAARADATAQSILAAGLALRLPYQLPAVLAVMRATRDAGYDGPVANLSFPDVTGPVLARLGLAPTVGLGNAAMVVLRVRAALRASEPAAALPLVRVIGQHSQVFGVMQATEPIVPDERCQVFLGEVGRRDDALAYRAPAMAPGLRYNPVTAAASLPVLEALLPGSEPLRWSTPAPAGLPGGYPVRIAGGAVALDLPPGITREAAVAFNERMGRDDGFERVDDDGTVHFSERCREAVAGFAPDLAEPLAIGALQERAARLDAILAS